MGWASGSALADSIWEIIEDYLPKSKKIRQKIARDLIDAFESEDCDTMCETTLAEIAGIVHDDEIGSYFPWRKK